MHIDFLCGSLVVNCELVNHDPCTVKELHFVWTESEELMLEFAELVPFYRNMGRPQVSLIKICEVPILFCIEISGSVKWRFPKMAVPLNHPFYVEYVEIFHSKPAKKSEKSEPQTAAGHTTLVLTMESAVVAQHLGLRRLHFARPRISRRGLPERSGAKR